MATYTYTAEWEDGLVSKCGAGYIDYNITPASGMVGPGTRITISGRVRGNTKAIKSIGVVLDADFLSTPVIKAARMMLGYINKSIAKATTTAFSITFTIPVMLWNRIKATGIDVSFHTIQLIPAFIVGTKTLSGKNVNNADWTYDVSLEENAGYAYALTYIASGVSPYSMNLYDPAALVMSSAPAVTDEAAVSALTVLGNIVTVHSLPRVSGSWAYDSRYPDQLGHVALALSGAMTGTYEVDTGSGVTAAAFDLPAPTQAGTVSWVYTVTDMFGNSAVASGSFTVLSYAKPEINAWMPERYHVVITPTGPATEEADDGEKIWVTILANIAAVNSCNAWQATLTAWRAGEPEIDPVAGEARAEDATGAVATIASWSLSGSDGQSVELRRNEAQLNDLTLSASLSWRLRLTITDALGNSATVVSDDIEKAGAMFDVEPGGVAVGQRVTSQESAPRFQCALPAEFAGDVAVPAGGLLKVARMTLFSSVNIAAKAVKSGTYTITTSDVGAGWTAVGVVGYSMGQSTFNVYRLRLAIGSTDTIEYSVANLDTSAHTGSLGCMVLCVRTGL